MLSKFCINTLLKRYEVFEPIYFTFCAKGSCSQIDFISTLKCQEIGYTIFVLPLNHNLRCYLVSHVSGNFRLEDKHSDDFSIVDDRAVTQGGHGSGTGCWGYGRGDRATETWNPNCQLKRPSFFQTFLPVICFRSGWKCLYTMLIIDVISPFLGFCSSQPSSWDERHETHERRERHIKPDWDVSLILEYSGSTALLIFFDICYTAPIANSPLVDLDLITEYFS